MVGDGESRKGRLGRLCVTCFDELSFVVNWQGPPDASTAAERRNRRRLSDIHFILVLGGGEDPFTNTFLDSAHQLRSDSVRFISYANGIRVALYKLVERF